MLADLDDDHITSIWEVSARAGTAPKTVQTLGELRTQLDAARKRGYALVDQELEIGVRSIAAPVRDASGHAIAAVIISTHANRTTLTKLLRRFVPALLRTAGEIEHALASRSQLNAP